MISPDSARNKVQVLGAIHSMPVVDSSSFCLVAPPMHVEVPVAAAHSSCAWQINPGVRWQHRAHVGILHQLRAGSLYFFFVFSGLADPKGEMKDSDLERRDAGVEPITARFNVKPNDATHQRKSGRANAGDTYGMSCLVMVCVQKGGFRSGHLVPRRGFA
jgi:hypothetical protein